MVPVPPMRELSASDLLRLIQTACQTTGTLDTDAIVQESRLQPLIEIIDDLRKSAEISDPDAAVALHQCADAIRAIQWNRVVALQHSLREQRASERRQQEILIARKTAFLRRHRGEYVHA